MAILLVLGPAVFIATQCYGTGPAPAAPSGVMTDYPDAVREESYTFLTLPEWLIVYSAEEYAGFLGREAPSRFPYLESVAQYWRTYDAVCEVTRGRYEFQTGYHVMLGVIGASFTAETLIKGVYENTIGRLTEWIASHDTPEDAWAVRTATEYGAFMHSVPWYQFPFASRLATLWSETPIWGPGLLRKWERRFALTAEYGVKAGYGWVMGALSQGAYGAEAEQILVHITEAPRSIFVRPGIVEVEQIGERSFLARLPRYERFTQAALALDAAGVRFVTIAGNDELLLTSLTPALSPIPGPPAAVVSSLPLATNPALTRVALRVPLSALSQTLAHLRANHATIEHLYDY